ncbi:hypothetical protein FVER14953_21756 [Fusarium verticillioides]|nr:hypothetical protein FVER14953_21756 [Fusarium verticillioides]
MDPVTAIGSFAILIASIREVVVIIARIRDPLQARFMSVQASLTAEEARLATWVQFMKVTDWNELESVLREEDKEIIRPLWANLYGLIDKARRQLNKLNNTEHQSLARIHWAIGKYEQLREIIEAIHNINEALYAISTPPPRYIPPFAPSSASNPPRQTHPPPDSQEGEQIREMRGSGSKIQAQPTRVIRILFHQAVTGLITIWGTGLAPKKVYDQLAALQRWPGSFLEGELALDILLRKKSNDKLLHEDLKNTIMITFVDILLLEESLLTYLVKHTGRRVVHSMLLSIVSSFSPDEVSEIESRRTPLTLQDLEENQLFEKVIELLGPAIEDLYDLLPIIRLLRRGELLDREQKQSVLISDTAPTEQTLHLFLQKTDSVIAAAESQVGASSIQDTVLKILRKERERLAEFAAKIPADQLNRNQEKEIKMIVQSLQKGLGKFDSASSWFLS